MERSGADGCSGFSAWFIKSIAGLKLKNRMMLNAKDPAIRMKFFRPPAAWWTPNAVSIWNIRVLAAFLTALTVPAFPETAVSGETFDAFFAGERAASSTVIKPISAPAARPIGLIPTAGIPAKYVGLKKRSMAQSPQTTITLKIRPAGIALLHHPRASRLTNRRICF